MNLDQFVAWARSQKTPLLYAPNRQREPLRGQCVQLVCLYVQKVWGKPVIWADAIQWMNSKNLPQHYVRVIKDRHDPHQVPPRGALVVFSGSLPGSSGAGHISICYQAKPSQATWISLDANWGGKLPHLVTHNWQYVVGWLVPRSPATTTAPQQGGDEMISSNDDAQKLYRLLRPNGGASAGEIGTTVGKRTYHNFLNDAGHEVKLRDTNLAQQRVELAKMQGNINELNRTITDLRASKTVDAQVRAEEQRAASEKISYLTGQLESSHDNITQLQMVDVPAQVEIDANKPNILTRLIIALLPKKK